MNPLALSVGAYCVLAVAIAWLALISLRLDRKAAFNRIVMVDLAFEALHLVAAGLALQATDGGTYWVSLKISATATFSVSFVSTLAMAIYAGIAPGWRWAVAAPVGLFSLSAAALVWTGHGFIAGFHSTAWGNVGQLSTDAGVRTFGSLMNFCNSAASIFLLGWAWFQRRSKHDRTILAYVTVLSVLTGGWMYLAFAVLWLSWGLPDFSGLGISLAILFYLYLIGHFQHLSEDNPNFGDLLVSNLKGIVLFANRQGQTVQASARANQLLGVSVRGGGRLTEVLKDWPGLEDEWKLLARDLAVSKELKGTLGDARYRLTLIPHRNNFHEFNGAIVRLVPEGFFDEVIREYGISPREHDVARLLLEGMELRQIAEVLFISLGTVRNHLHRLYQKTGTKSRSDLTRRLLAGHPSRVE